ncbi:urease accessory protein D [Melia azedarach]|uniref:Urease accessory protein D n=1 Tax=Melia azedarach TaxID=155640 RepID=A0ACC1WUH5_MELAZ|nr:urease accessory protein D [Melia azedarach]
METQTGKLVVEKVGGKSTVTRCFSKYPLKFIIPNKVGSSETDAVWIYTLTYGGGIVSGDSISSELSIGDGCTAVLTTQASTKVYKALGSKCSEQILEARIGSDALLAVIPDPVTCFSTARYSQKQIFRVVSDSSLVVVDWITSGRHESGEKWDFELYKSTNHIFLEGDQPLFLDTVLLEQGSISKITEHMRDYQVVAMVILLGPKLKQIQIQVQENVKRMMSEQLYIPSTALHPHGKTQSNHHFAKPDFIASCSIFGPKEIGIVVRLASTTTESVYRFLQHQLAGMETLLGVAPYS